MQDMSILGIALQSPAGAVSDVAQMAQQRAHGAAARNPASSGECGAGKAIATAFPFN